MSRRSAETVSEKRPLALIAVLIGGATLVGLANHYDETMQPTHAFQRQFTDSGKCLEGTPYDKAKGADVHVRSEQVNGAEILQVVPKSANEIQPSVLFLQVEGHGPFRQSTFTVADHYAGTILVQYGCIGENSGQ